MRIIAIEPITDEHTYNLDSPKKHNLKTLQQQYFVDEDDEQQFVHSI